ncbi:MAG: hypothetical protein D4R73_10460 [Deltaproteobacteria bacterium]|jgi:hypothetical protein|nr:MAG: hypothetical protein D4R73_10460 [Deltaproteobacteria bacterium]
MRQYLIDELDKGQIEQIAEYLREHAHLSSVEGLFWVDLPDDLLAETQYTHKNCKPFCFSIEVCEDCVKFEFLIRSKQTLHCDCIQYASKAQRDFILGFAEKMLSEKGIRA